MRWSHPRWMIRQFFRIFLLTIVAILVIVTVVTFSYAFYPSITVQAKRRINHYTSSDDSKSIKALQYFIPLSEAPKRHINVLNGSVSSAVHSTRSISKCSFHSCFNLYRCGRLGQDQLTVYVYPVEKFLVNGRPLQDNLSKEFYLLIHSIVRSPYYVTDPSEACIFVPTIDLLNLNQFLHRDASTTMGDVLAALQSLEYWGEDGSNHLLFSMSYSAPLTQLLTSAILVSSSFSGVDYRLGFHVPFVTFSPNNISKISSNNGNTSRKIFCVAAQSSSKSDDLFQDKILVLDYCQHNTTSSIRCKDSIVYRYPEVLSMSEYCIVDSLAHPILWDAMSVGCIPVILPGLNRLPFDEVIDWNRNAIILYDHQLPEISTILKGISTNRKDRLKSQIRFTFDRYFQTVPHLVSTVMEVVKERVFPHSARTILQWNDNPQNRHKTSPMFNPVIAPAAPGFTAVILAYERIPSLFRVIERIQNVPSLAKILVVWNNQKVKPPPENVWPKISKPFKIIQTTNNVMSNRFFPYAEIQTEAVFSLDDDIIMLTVDEISFAFQVWREFPDRLVGFPSRTHIWDNITSKWKYESEWTNEVSMVLTGAAFYHKYWHFSYFHEMPAEVRSYVDTKMNCEDIAMNFLIANSTGKAAIKVTPRKKFKCPTCSNNEMLSADTSHMKQRTECINRFGRIYGYMPLLPVEFRADPVLYKVEKLPRRLKKFADIGSI